VALYPLPRSGLTNGMTRTMTTGLPGPSASLSAVDDRHSHPSALGSNVGAWSRCTHLRQCSGMSPESGRSPQTHMRGPQRAAAWA
jgi:hypothetical protein